MYSGEYNQSQQRKSRLLFPVVSGYTTCRMRATPSVANDQAGTPFVACQAMVQNDGTSAVTYEIVQTDDVSASGTRTVVASGTISPGGIKKHQFDSLKNFLEVRSTSGSSTLILDIASQRRFTPQAFNKTDTLYPKSLWQGKLPS